MYAAPQSVHAKRDGSDQTVRTYNRVFIVPIWDKVSISLNPSFMHPDGIILTSGFMMLAVSFHENSL